MKRFFGKLFPWRTQIAALRASVSALTIQNGVLLGLVDEERAKRDKLASAHAKNLQGTTVLLQFIHRTHRLNVPFAEGSIREAIQNGMNNHPIIP